MAVDTAAILEQEGRETQEKADREKGEKEKSEEIEELRRLSKWICLYLVAVMTVAFLTGVILLGKADAFLRVLAQSLIGVSGSAIAALTSSLDRYANGFELSGEKGGKALKIPAPESKDDEKKQMFNRRMARWFMFRPSLGILMAPVFVWGMGFFGKEPATPQVTGFYAFMGGLLAKSVIDAIKGLFKSIFKA